MRSLSSITSSRLSRIARWRLLASWPAHLLDQRVCIGWSFIAARAIIRIGDAQTGKDLHFQRLHHAGVAGAYMVMARQMQNAMHHQMDGMIGDTFARLPWLRGASRHRRSADVAGIACLCCGAAGKDRTLVACPCRENRD